MGELCLLAKDYKNAACWRWVLSTPDGQVLVEHEVRLDPGCSEFEAFADLAGYLRIHVIPDRRAEDEARIVTEVGEWIGTHVFGPVAPIIVAASPVTVRVVFSQGADELLLRPLELAHVNGTPVALQGVTLVMQPSGEDTDGTVAPVGQRLRVLGLFSLPTGQKALNLRQERQALVHMFSATATGMDRDVRILQYGVTRARLKEVLAEPEGWDLIHISGHGAPGELLLEREDGSPDPIASAELASLLGLARGRPKLVTVLACWSAAAARREILGLPRGEDSDADADGPGQEARRPAAVLAADLANLGCAVLAMRYPVTDDFAIALSADLYRRLLSGASLPQALGAALKEIVPTSPTAAYPAMSVACPALLGASAARLRLPAPKRSGSRPHESQQQVISEVAPLERFVGRTQVMTAASAALAPRSGMTGVLLYGMPGGGKTACARELAYTHQHAFDGLVWFKAPDDGREAIDSLGDFALQLERALPGFQIRHLLDHADGLAAALPELTQRCEQRRLVIVIDNAESLLAEDGQWLDARWHQVISAMCAHSGLSRVVLTSRRRPTGLDLRVVAIPVGALDLDEALLLARELPHLAKLLDGRAAGLDAARSRKLARDVLNTAQGHPKLLELADGQAAHLDRLRALVLAGEQAWDDAGGLPEGFFTDGEPHAPGEDYLHVLTTWANSVSRGLQPSERDLFWFLCCLEEADRKTRTIQATWPHLWDRLRREGTPPDTAAVADLAALGLIGTPAGLDRLYEIHPVVAAVGRTQAGEGFQQAIDTVLAVYWSMLADSQQREAQELDSSLLIAATLSAVPYLLRLGYWRDAAGYLESVLYRDGSAAVAAAARPILMKIAEAVAGTPDELDVTYVVARALDGVDPARAELVWRKVLTAAVASQDFGDACVAADGLARHYLRAGRLEDALRLGEDSARYAHRAGLGIWTELSGKVVALTARVLMGQAAQVIDTVYSLRAQMEALPAEPADVSGNGQGAEPWDVRERLLDAGRLAAIHLGRWQEALELNAATVASMREREAPESKIAHSRFGMYSPLIALGHIDEARALLGYCREAAERARDIAWLGQIFDALARVEHERGHVQDSVRLEQEGLRYNYLARDTENIWVGHFNLGSFLLQADHPEAALTHHLAAALIQVTAGRGNAQQSVGMMAKDLAELGDAAQLPADVTELCRRAADVPGVLLSRELIKLSPDPVSSERALAELIARAQTAATARLAPWLAMWDPVCAGLVSASYGDEEAAAAVEQHLAEGGIPEQWGNLVTVLHRILAGERSVAVLAGLDTPEAAVARRALDAIAGRQQFQLSYGQLCHGVRSWVSSWQRLTAMMK